MSDLSLAERISTQPGVRPEFVPELAAIIEFENRDIGLSDEKLAEILAHFAAHRMPRAFYFEGVDFSLVPYLKPTKRPGKPIKLPPKHKPAPIPTRPPKTRIVRLGDLRTLWDAATREAIAEEKHSSESLCYLLIPDLIPALAGRLGNENVPREDLEKVLAAYRAKDLPWFNPNKGSAAAAHSAARGKKIPLPHAEFITCPPQQRIEWANGLAVKLTPNPKSPMAAVMRETNKQRIERNLLEANKKKHPPA